MLRHLSRLDLPFAALAIAACWMLGATPPASAAVLYYEDFEDTTLEADTTTNFATIAGGYARFVDNSTTTRGRFVVRRTFDEPVMTFSFDTAEPATNTAGQDNELVFRAGIGTANNTLSSGEQILEAVLWRTSGGGTGGGNVGAYTNSGNETMVLVANNDTSTLKFFSPVDGSIVTLGPFQYIPFIRDNDTGDYGILKGVTDFAVRDTINPPGDVIRFGIGSSSNGHQGTFAIDNVSVESGLPFEIVPEPCSVLLAMAAFLGFACCRRCRY